MSSRHELRGSHWKRKERVCVNEMVQLTDTSSHYIRKQSIPVSITNTADWSLSLFFYLDGRKTSGLQFLLDNYAGNAGGGIAADADAANLKVNVVNSGTTLSIGGPYQMVTGTVHHMIVTHSSANKTFNVYADGKLLKSTVYTTETFTGRTIMDYGTYWGGNFLSGGFAHACFFNRVLTAQEASDIHKLGGVLPTGVHAACVMHLHKAEGRKWYDCVEQYNYAKAAGSELVNSHADLINYTDAEVGLGVNGVADRTSLVDFYTKAYLQTAPAVKNGISGSITYPTGTEVISVKGYNVIAYKAHTLLTEREKLELKNNTWPVDAPAWVRSKLSNYYLHNEVVNGAITDLIGTTNATVAAGYTIKSISDIKQGL